MKLFGIAVPSALEEAVRACRKHFLLAALFSALINILYLAPTLYMMQVYDRVVPTGGVVTLLWITAIVAFAIGTLAALESVRSRLMVRASLRLDRLLSGEILDRLLARAKLKQGDATTGQAMREFDVLRQTLGGQAVIALFDAPWTPLYVLAAFLLHPALGGLVLVSGAILVSVALANQRATRTRAQNAHSATALAYASQEATSSRSEIVRALGMRRALVSRQLRERSEGMALTAEAQFASARYMALAKFFRLFLQSLALGVGAWLAVERQISVGAIIAASVLLSRALQPVELLVATWGQILQAREAALMLARLFADTAPMQDAKTLLPAPKGQIELDRASVRAPGREDFVLKRVSLRLAPGEMLGIVGASGAGKTTLARVIAGALVPDGGGARIDGADYRDWDAERLAVHIGYLPQDPSLLAGTISENISRFAIAAGCDPHEVAAAVVAAATAAGAHDMILRLPGGYDARLDHAGRGLSAGQAQRIAFARALYRDPAVLVLDEPNSALDAEGEAALAAAMAKAKDRGAAVVIVAHRMGILNGADRLIVMRDGAIDRIGPRGEILAYLNGWKPTANVVEMKGA